MDLRPRRSLLYMPANRASAIAKARTLDCDVVILDLEDSVASDQKALARAAAVAAVAAGSWGHREIAVRTNGLATEWAADDLAAVVAARPDAVVVPKVDGPEQAARAVELAQGVPVWAMIETPRGLLAAAAIAATPGIAALIAGFADLAADLRLQPDAARTPLQFAMSAIVLAARAAGGRVFDGMFPNIQDAAGLRAEAVQARMFGFDGKTLIHPTQIEVANECFAASQAELDEARGVIDAFEAAAAAGAGVTTYRGRLIEVLHVTAAQQLLAANSAISAQRLG
jgi:citrate lyase beta subunit